VFSHGNTPRKKTRFLNDRQIAEGEFLPDLRFGGFPPVRALISLLEAEKYEEIKKVKKFESKLFSIIAVFLLMTAAAFGANKFEGYSLVVEADDSGVCPVQYLGSPNNDVDVFVAGTTTAATGLTACNGSTVSGNNVAPNGATGQWCFQGNNDFYEVLLSNGVKYLWYPNTKTTGFFNVKDFRPYNGTAFTDPPDYTKTIKNAVAFIAARQGGTLYFPEGLYTVGTTDGNTRDTSYQAITLPGGIVIQGASPHASIPSTNLPSKQSATSIRLRNNNQTIFRIGGCTDKVTIKNLELLGNSATSESKAWANGR